jgi:hypothetical protein
MNYLPVNLYFYRPKYAPRSPAVTHPPENWRANTIIGIQAADGIRGESIPAI